MHRALQSTRLLTLAGTCGCGKTRLALQAAADALDRFPDGRWWVDLAPLNGATAIGQALADALEVRPHPGQSALDAAIAHLTAHRALVVLDNCEHLRDAAADTALALLRECPGVTVLTTSRAPLELPPETIWRVPSLSLPGELDPEAVGSFAESDAVRLFVERATQIQPDFTMTPASAHAVATVCAELDGIPLAIELAAARVRLESVEQIAAGLSDRFRLLTDGSSTGLPRHRTLRASLDWSYELLSDDERTLFRRLAAFAGGFTLEAAEAACATEHERQMVLDVLGGLVDKSLVVAEERGSAMRYRLLETMRQYAVECLRQTDELEAVRNRHRDFFLALAERAAPELLTARGRECLAMLDTESANLAIALQWAIATDGERALRLCAALVPWWRLRGMFTAGDAGCAKALEVSDSRPSALRARVIWGRGFLLAFAGRNEEAIRVLQEAASVAETVGDESTTARALATRGLTQRNVDAVGSRPLMKRAHDLAQASGDDWCLVVATYSLAWTYLATDEYDEAERLFQRYLPIVERTGDRELKTWHRLGMTVRHMTEANSERLLEAADRAIAASRDLGDAGSEGLVHSFVAFVELAQGRTEEALQRLETSRKRLVANGAGLGLPHTDVLIGTARAERGELDAARAVLERVVASGADLGASLVWALVQLANVLNASGEPREAEERARQALEISERVRSPLCRAWSREVLGRLAGERGELHTASSLLHEALALQADRGLRLWLPQTLDALAEVAAWQSRYVDATRLLGAAERARSDLGLVRWALHAPRLEATEQHLRTCLDEAEFADAWREGAQLTLQEAVAWMSRGRGRRRRPASGWESLTPTELEVARHVAAGLTNAQIAEAMFVTPGTVKTHLSHIYSKLGVHGRSALAAETTHRTSIEAR